MKRQIKFRGFCTTCKEKIEGDLLHGVGSKSGKFFILPIKHNLAYIKHCHPLDGVEVFPDSIGQFTGHKDKNGKDIFEGDILNFLDGKNTSSECGFDWEEDYSIGDVYWCSERKGWQVSNQVMTDDDSVWEDIVIIGNIYENPELLNSQK